MDILIPQTEPEPAAPLILYGNDVASFTLGVGEAGARLALVNVAEEPDPPQYSGRTALVLDSEQVPVFATGIAGGALSVPFSNYRLPLAQQSWPEEDASPLMSEWRTNERAEYAFQFLNVVDLLQTITALQSGNAAEANPVYGRNPSVGTLLTAKTLVGAVHYALSDYLEGESPALLGVWQYGTLAVMSGVVSWNMQFVF